MPKERTPAETLADAKIEPIIAWTEAERGRKSELVREVQAAAGDDPPTRNLIESWIHPDLDKRKNPTLPNGLLLLQVAEKLGALPKTPTRRKASRE